MRWHHADAASELLQLQGVGECVHAWDYFPGLKTGAIQTRSINGALQRYPGFRPVYYPQVSRFI